MVSPPSYERASSVQAVQPRRPMSTSPRLPAIPIPAPRPSGGSSSTSYSHSQPSSARSPATSSSLSSYRSHPYTRRPSGPQLPSPTDSQNLPRIHLPPPSASGQLRSGEIPGLASLALASPPEWLDRSRPPLSHSTSAGRPVLPPLHHSVSRDAPSAKNMPPPPLRPESPSSPHPSYSHGPPGPLSASVSAPPGLRPSYGYEQPPPTRWHSYGGYRDEGSPPLRPLQEPYYTQHGAPSRSFTREPRPHPPPHYPPPPHARSRSQSETSIVSRPGEEGELGGAPHGQGLGQGQNRRLAHLMSEQKRRESINSGFAALRAALPSSIPTDSKAIILRKAVLHIKHLETLARRAGLEPNMALAMGGGGSAGGIGPGGAGAGAAGGARYDEWEGDEVEDDADEDMTMDRGDGAVRVKEEEERWSRAE